MNLLHRCVYGMGLLGGIMMITSISAGENDGPLNAEGSAWAAFYEAGDLDGLMTLYMDDVVVALHGQPALFGKAAVREYFSSRIGKSAAKFELEYEVTQTHGNIAYLISKYWLRAVNNETGAVYKEAGRSMLVYKKDIDQRWKIAADIDQVTPDVSWPSPAGMD